jgi:hypothetical protein
LTNATGQAKNTANSARKPPAGLAGRARPEIMSPSSPHQPPAKSDKNDMAPCKHPRVRVVAREDDAEFVECLECGEVFESSEFKDMYIEETKLKEG